MSPGVDALPVLEDPHFSELKRFIIGATGLAYYAERDEELASRVAGQIRSTGARDCGAYLGLLRDAGRGESVLDRIVGELTIGETYFFRHQDQFEALRKSVLPDIIERNRSRRRLRIWSAGCAAGPEPYSLAILLRRELARWLHGWDVEIVGTDMNRNFLMQAREGSYTEWSFRGMPDAVRRSCFRENGGRWTILPEFKEVVSFQYHNLAAHPFPSLVNNLYAFDLILCRNVAIYFDAGVTRALVQRFHRTLVDGGWLVMGHAELHPGWFDPFEAVTVNETTFYRKKGDRPIAPAVHPPAAPMVAPLEVATPVPSQPAPPRAAAPSVERWRSSDAPAPPDTAEPCDGFDAVRKLADRGELEAALKVAQALLERHPLDARVHFYKALILEQMRGDAESCLRAAIYLDRDYVVAHYHLGLVLQSKAKHRRAARCFENVRTLVDKMGSDRTFDDADGMTGSDLVELAGAHLDVLDSGRPQ